MNHKDIEKNLGLMLVLVASPLGRIFGEGGRTDAPEVRAFD